MWIEYGVAHLILWSIVIVEFSDGICIVILVGKRFSIQSTLVEIRFGIAVAGKRSGARPRNKDDTVVALRLCFTGIGNICGLKSYL